MITILIPFYHRSLSVQVISWQFLLISRLIMVYWIFIEGYLYELRAGNQPIYKYGDYHHILFPNHSGTISYRLSPPVLILGIPVNDRREIIISSQYA